MWQWLSVMQNSLLEQETYLLTITASYTGADGVEFSVLIGETVTHFELGLNVMSAMAHNNAGRNLLLAE